MLQPETLVYNMVLRLDNYGNSVFSQQEDIYWALKTHPKTS